MSRRWAAGLGLLLLGGCLFGPGEEEAPRPSERVDVVAEEDEPFDPSKAVDDTGRGVAEKSAGGEPGEKEEDVATEAEAEVRGAAAQRTTERIDASGGDDEGAKVSAAANPPPRDPGSGEPWTRVALDWALELVLVLALAALLTAPCLVALRWIDDAERAWRSRSKAARRHAVPRGRSKHP